MLRRLLKHAKRALAGDPARSPAEDLAGRLLAELPKRDQEAIMRFYADGENAEQIERSLGMDAGRLRQLRRSLRDRFNQERRRIGSLQ
ncbi:MAG: hypothetical protein LAP87_15800 [Acidobacteriia bacterium]|nr:hypothetical protein [Terriglobia bacterium]